MKYSELVKKAMEMLNNNDDLFVEMVDKLDSYMGYADGYKCWEMDMLNEMYYGVEATKLINDLTEDFNINDMYFYWSIYGLESVNDKVGLYRDKASEGEVFDNIIENANNLYFNDSDFEEIVKAIVDGDYDEEQESENKESEGTAA